MNHAPAAEFTRLPSSEEPVRIMVGWDGANTEALEFAAWLGRSVPISVQLMSNTSASWTKSVPRGGKSRKKWVKAAADFFGERAKRNLDEHLPRSQWASDTVKLVDRKDPVRALQDTAVESNADLILLGSRAKAPKGRFRPSTVADELMRSSPVPLGLAPRGVKLSKKGVTRISYAIVEPADNAPVDLNFPGLDFATTLACYLRLPLRIIAFSPTSYDKHSTAWNEATLGVLDRARDRAWTFACESAPERAEHFDVQSSISAAKSWKRAIDSVKWKKGDLLCLGSQGSSSLRSVFVGTREGEFIRYAPVPVIICPRHGEQ